MNLSKIRKCLTQEYCEIAVHVAHVGLFDPERSIKAYVAKFYIAGITYCLISFISRHVFKTRPNSARALLAFPVTNFPIGNRIKI